MKRRRWLLLYLLLLLASHGWRAWRPPSPHAPASGIRRIELPPGTAGNPDPVLLPWRSWKPASPEGGKPVLLLHGSPGSSRDFRTLGPATGERRLALAPDLPGFGASHPHLPDYSHRAHAQYLLAWLGLMDLESVHLVAFSMSGGVALHLLEAAPERFVSLSLISAIGVQEWELTGNYALNHLLHRLQHRGLWTLLHGLPHFGWLDDGMLDLSFSRNFLDSDQRPYRIWLERLKHPTLILHGARDFLVPLAAAREHHRLIENSRLEILDANHFFLFSQGQQVAEHLTPFWDQVESYGPPTPGEFLPFRLDRSDRSDAERVPASWQENPNRKARPWLLAAAAAHACVPAAWHAGEQSSQWPGSGWSHFAFLGLGSFGASGFWILLGRWLLPSRPWSSRRWIWVFLLRPLPGAHAIFFAVLGSHRPQSRPRIPLWAMAALSSWFWTGLAFGLGNAAIPFPGVA
ncbi:MAG: alpha/beta fold hydrolase [Planctomycetota bacterium]|nr:MAG: alpha/beta fold hydrolase [Planctomycetota bacterium]